MANKRILVISDTHAPFHHPDTLKFLAAIKDKYGPDKVVHIGDEIDNHAMSYHDSDPDCFSAGDELVRAREIVWQMEELYPKVDVIESNHGSLWYRKAKTIGLRAWTSRGTASSPVARPDLASEEDQNITPGHRQMDLQNCNDYSIQTIRLCVGSVEYIHWVGPSRDVQDGSTIEIARKT